jgi:hypothetical protein
MSEYFSFVGAAFVAVIPSSGDTPYWHPKVEATDRPIIGTDRFERSIRSRVWSMELDLWIEPSDVARTAFLSLQAAYALGTVGGLVLPGDPAPEPEDAVLVAFDVAPQRGGIDGYRGKAVFARPAGAP